MLTKDQITAWLRCHLVTNQPRIITLLVSFSQLYGAFSIFKVIVLVLWLLNLWFGSVLGWEYTCFLCARYAWWRPCVSCICFVHVSRQLMRRVRKTQNAQDNWASVASRHVSKWWEVLKMRCVINSSITHICLKCHCCCTVLIIIVKAAGRGSAAP